MKTLASIANGFDDSLISRAADECLISVNVTAVNDKLLENVPGDQSGSK